MRERILRQVVRAAGLSALLAWPFAAGAKDLAVGPGREFARIEEALAKAAADDAILVYPREGNAPYEKVALFVDVERLAIRAVPGKDGQRVKLSGKGYDYSGRGRIPRAIIQFNGHANGCTLDGFELFGAHNQSHNGAGVRIVFANDVTVRNCDIHGNDMGVMSNGDKTQKTAVNQLFEGCIIRENGDAADPGYNHNLYLGGTSVTLRFCEVYGSLTGSNVKSRAHYNRIEYCYVHDSSNREFDLVDAADTEALDSHAVLIGNVIVKDPACKGNRAVIHFGQDGGKQHDGTLYLVHNTIVTPFITAVVDLSASKAKAVLIGNIVTDGGGGPKNPTLVAGSRGGNAANAAGSHNWLYEGYRKSAGGTGLDLGTTTFGPRGTLPPFADLKGRDFHLSARAEGITDAGLPVEQLDVPSGTAVPAVDHGPEARATPADASTKTAEPEPLLKWQYKHPAAGEPRPNDGKPDLGAYEYAPK